MEIVLNNFTLSFFDDQSDGMSARKSFNASARKTVMEAFLSTPRFIKCLTDVSLNLSVLTGSRKEKKAMLMQDLVRIN